MKFRIVFILNFLLIAGRVFAQEFIIGDINSNNFPEMKTIFYVLDNHGKPLQIYDKDDIKIYENNKEINEQNISDLDCGTNYTSAQILLTFDVSTSMDDEIDGITKLEWVKKSILDFIATIKIDDYTKIAVTVFSSRALLMQDFTNDKEVLNDVIEHLPQHIATTDFNPPFLDEYAGAEALLSKRPNINRVMIFLTDGIHDATWRGPVQISKISQLLNQNHIKLHTVTFDNQISPELIDITRRTDGSNYIVRSGEGLRDLYKKLAGEVVKSDVKYCEIKWNSDLYCQSSPRYTKLNLVYEPYNIENQTSYTAPYWSIFDDGIDYSSLYFGSPVPESSEEKYITIKPKPYDYEIENIVIDDTEYFEIIDYGFGNSNPLGAFTVQSGSSHTIKVRFTQHTEDILRTAQLKILGSPCDKEIKLSGGRGELVITDPFSLQEFINCDDIEIRWEGVAEDTKTDLYFKNVKTKKWYMIAEGVTGLSYIWKQNNPTGDYLVRAVSKIENGNDDVLEAASDTFKLIDAELAILEDELEHDVLLVGEESTREFKNIAMNPTSQPLKIINYYLEGGTKDDFKIESISTDYLMPGDSVSVVITFDPVDDNRRATNLVLVSNCNYKNIINLSGYGLCETKSLDTIDMGDVYVDEYRDSLISHIFYNPTDLDITFKCYIVGNSDEFMLHNVFSDREITVPAGGFYDIKIRFRPKKTGIKIVKLRFAAESCESTETILKGIGVLKGLKINDLDFGRKLSKSKFDTLQIELVNLDKYAVKIKDYKLSNGKQGFEIIKDTIQYPYEFAGFDTLKLDVVFHPNQLGLKNDELVFQLVDGSELISNLKGETFLPEFYVETVCPEGVEIGDNSLAKLLIINKSTTERIKIDTCYLTSGFDEFFEIDTLPLPAHKEIEIGDTLVSYLIYNPIEGGNHSADISIWANNFDAEFDSTSKENFVSFECDIVDFSYIYDDYSHLIVCETDTLQVVIKNPTDNYLIEVYLPQVAGTGFSDYYSIINPENLIVLPNSSASFSIIVKPTARGEFFANLIVPTSTLQDIELELSGIAQEYSLSMSYDSIYYSPSDRFSQTVEIDIPKTENGYISEINLIVDYEVSMCDISDTDIISLISNDLQDENHMIWDIKNESQSGKITIFGRGRLIDDNSYKILKINMFGLLPDRKNGDMSCRLKYNCNENFEADTSYLVLNPNCLGERRFIESTGVDFFCNQPYPNPNSGAITIDFGIAYDFKTTIKLFSNDGREIAILLEEFLTVGRYKKEFSIPQEIANGEYILVFTCNEFTKSFSITIQK